MLGEVLDVLLSEYWDYAAAWLAYLGAAILFMAVIWHSTAWMSGPVTLIVRDMLKVAVATLLLFPASVMPHTALYAPALFAAPLYRLTGDRDAAIRINTHLVAVLLLLLVLTLLRGMWVHRHATLTPKPAVKAPAKKGARSKAKPRGRAPQERREPTL